MAAEEEFKSWLKNEGSRFKEALELSKERPNVETEPYKSKYQAREIWLNIKNNIRNILTSLNVDDSREIRLKSIQCAVDYELGLNYIETDEASIGEKYLNKIVEDFEDFRLKPEFCSNMIKCFHQLGMLWNSRGDLEKSLYYFNQAERIYDNYTTVCEVTPLFYNILFAYNEESTEDNSEFESLHTHTCFYLTQAYKNNGENSKSAEYGHKTLQRQLARKLYDPVDWAVNCATLSQYHLTQDDYLSARHCLAAASHVISDCPDKEQPHPSNVEEEGEDERKCREKVPEAKANIALCWSKYYLNLLKLSAENEDVDNTLVTDPTKETKNILKFDGLDVSKLESQISSEIANNFEEKYIVLVGEICLKLQARAVFLAGQAHLNSAKEFYQLDGHVVNYVEILQDHSQLFRYLTAFEQDLERQCKMCKRRIDMLAEVLLQLNPQHYLFICRQLTYEIASVYGDMADLKMELIKTSHQNKPLPHHIKKINSLFKNSAKFFTRFIDSLKQDGKLPDKIDESVLRVALLAHIYLARAHAKQICATREERLVNQQRALEFYKFVVDYCDNDENGARAVKDELCACREMVNLLPFRIDQIEQHRE